MAQYMLLLHENPAGFGDVSAEEMQAIIDEYGAWREGLVKQGRFVAGHKLADEGGKVLRSDGGELRILDGPFSEAKEVVGGYFILEASDYDEAVEMSSGCPHLKYGERIELRRIDPIVE